ncbi:MAG: tRNA (guanosine(46)-N7)-methyltransferase TrmB [Bacilli bacterium]|nr:tRNA (guanosine(46)-N7)-methyltransferase TrmB [Bacilli bacterium]
MRTRYKPWAKPYLQLHREIVLANLADDVSFFATENLAMEIGCGKGDFIVALAEANPATHYLAIEVSPIIAAMATRKIVDKQLTNVRVITEDVAKILPSLNDMSLDAIYLNFSDPWPKRRHEKRRLTFPAKLLEYKRILKSGGYLFFKSDNDGLYEYSRQTFAESPLEVISETNNYETLEVGDALSEYERQFRSEGKNINRIVARRK